MRSELDVHIDAHRPGLTRENQAVGEIHGPEDVGYRHVDQGSDHDGARYPRMPDGREKLAARPGDRERRDAGWQTTLQ
jgi:hypothetical protein